MDTTTHDASPALFEHGPTPFDALLQYTDADDTLAQGLLDTALSGEALDSLWKDRRLSWKKQMFIVCHLGVKMCHATQILRACHASKSPNQNITVTDLVDFLQQSTFSVGDDASEIRTKMRPSFLTASLVRHRVKGGFRDSIPDNLDSALSINVPTFIAAWQLEASTRLDQNFYSLATAILLVVPNSAQLPPWLIRRSLAFPYPTIEQIFLRLSRNSPLPPHWICGTHGKVYVSLQLEQPPHHLSTPGAYVRRLPILDSEFRWHCPVQEGIPHTLSASSLTELGKQIGRLLQLDDSDIPTPEKLIWIDYLVVNDIKQATYDAIEDLIHSEVPDAVQIMYLVQEEKWEVLVPTPHPSLQQDCFIVVNRGTRIGWQPRQLDVTTVDI